MRTPLAAAAATVAALAGALLVLPASPAVAGDSGGERIRSYDVALDVRGDGSLRVEETISYDFGGNQRHGIERGIDNEQRFDGSRDRVYPIQDVEVSSETAPDQVQVSQSGGEVHLRIGDPDRIVTGTHTYRIGYTALAATTRFADRDELYWNAVGPGWQVPVEAATVRLSAAADVTRTACYSGPPGTRTPCTSADGSGRSASYRGGPLFAGDALTVVAAFPVGSVATAAPVLTDRLTARRFLVGRPAVALPATAAIVGLPVLWLLTLWRRRRDLAASVPPHLPGVQTAPPAGIRPALVSTVLHGSFKSVDQVAVLLDLSARGYLSITPIKKREWRLVATRPPDRTLHPEEWAVLQAAFADGPDTLLSKAGRRLASARSRVRGAVYSDVMARGWFSRRPGSGRVLPAVLGGIALFLAIPVTLVLGFAVKAGIVGLALGLAGILLIACAVVMPAPRTPEGEAVRSRLIAFRQHLAGIDPGRLPPERRQAAFAGLLPYAVVLALAPQLSRALQAAGVGYGYSDPTWWNTFSSDATRASSPVTSSSGGGSSGFSGSSGGGGGGGGGGSW